MSGRHVDQNWEMLAEDLEHRKWGNEQIEGMHNLIQHSALMSSEGVSVLLDYINQSDYVAKMKNDNEAYKKVCEHLQEREWNEVQIINFTHKAAQIGSTGLRGVLELLEYQQQVDENIQAGKQHDKVFTTNLKYDDMGNYINPPDGRWDVC